MSETISNPSTDKSSDIIPTTSRTRWGSIVAWSLLVIFLGLLAFGLINSKKGPLQEGSQIKDFTLNTFDGQVINTADLRGKIIVINIWASWCTTCKVEAADLETAWQTYKPTDQVVFLGVDYVDTESKALEYINKYGITYLNGPDLGQKIYTSFGATGVPETYVIDQNGKLASRMIGSFSNLSQIKAMIEPLLSD